MANIAVICDREFFQPFDQRVYKEVCSMKKEGHQIEIITPHESTGIKEFEGIKVHCIETKGPPGMVALKIIKKALMLQRTMVIGIDNVALSYKKILPKLIFV